MFNPQPKRPKPVKDRVWSGAIHYLPCSVENTHGSECKGGITQQHAQGQHLRSGYRRASDYDSYPLCWGHHITGPNSITEMGINGWVEKYGSEEEFIDRTIRELAARGYKMKEPK